MSKARHALRTLHQPVHVIATPVATRILGFVPDTDVVL